MSSISVSVLIACGVTPTLAKQFADPLARAFDRFGIDSPVRKAAFIAQATHESQGFARLEENCRWTDPARIMQFFPSSVHDIATAQTLVKQPERLANFVYANKIGNGDYASGEGWKYRGRGLFQLTGRSNYSAAGMALGRPYKDQPELVSQPLDACMTAAWYWSERHLNDLADASLIDAITRKINPAMAGADDRHQRFDVAIEAFREETANQLVGA